jgi:transcriptional regulator with XRE-family HTH domain
MSGRPGVADGGLEMLGANVRELRQRLGLSQEDLATKAGVDAKTIHRIEAGESVPRPSTPPER